MSIQVNDKNLGHATAYAYAVAGGYTGTEAEFTELLGNIADDLGQIENLTVTVETLAAGSSATASYSNGVLHLGIPKGDKGDGAYHVEPSGESFVIHTDADGIVTSAQEIRISINAKQGTSAMVISSVTGLPNISLAGGGNITPEILKNAFTGSVATIIYTIPANSQITAEQINAQYIARVNNGTPNGYGISCSLSVAVVKDGAKGDTGATGSTGPTGNGIASVAKTGTSGLVDTYTITYTNGNTSTFTVTNGAEAVDNTLTIAGRAADAKKTGDEISELKEDFATMESDGVVPSADQILSDNGVTDSVPYHYRKTGGDGADRLYDQIVGGTVCFNQLCNDASVIVQSGRKYLSKIGTAWAVGTSTGTAITGLTSGADMIIDLTAMFGTTIADYVYTLETATAGAGVAWLKAHFPKIFDAGYIPYNAGTLEHVSGLSEHKTVGFNQWDGTYTANTWLSATDGTTAAQSGYNLTDFIRVFQNTKYHVTGSGSGRFLFYDSEKVALSGQAWASNSSERILTTPAGASYVRFTITTGNLSGFMFNLSDPAKNGTYEPYKAHSYPLDDSLTLRGLFKLDANNNLYADGDTYDADGTVTRRYGIVDLGTLNWTRNQSSVSGNYYYVGSAISDMKKQGDNYSLWNNMIISCGYSNGASATIALGTASDKTYGGYDLGTIRIKDDSYTDATTFKTAMSGVMLVYELATPTTEEATPYQHLQQCDPNGTEEYVSTGIVPVGHNSFYPENLRAKVEQLPWNFANLIAPTESAFVATRNYVTGDLFIVNNVLYKATSNIANGGSITPNTNCTATTLAEIISALA